MSISVKGATRFRLTAVKEIGDQTARYDRDGNSNVNGVRSAFSFWLAHR